MDVNSTYGDLAVPFELSSGPFIFNWLAEWTYYNFILIYYKLSTVGQILFPVSILDRYSMVFDEDLHTAVQFSVMIFSGLSAAILLISPIIILCRKFFILPLFHFHSKGYW